VAPIEKVYQFKAGKYSSYVLFNDKSVGSCGRNNNGQLGDGTTADKAITVVELDNVVTLLGVGPSAESAFFY
jgi:alpha-tubulin suppressor-like RCC1 family protein